MNFIELLGPIENSVPENFQMAIVWGPEIMLMDSVEYFLKTRAGWNVIKISNECGIDYLIQRITALKPAVVILCQEKDVSDVAVLMQLAQIQDCMKVVAVSLESNRIQVYSRQHIIMHEVSDLLAVIDHEYSPNTDTKAEVQVIQTKS